MTSVPNSLVVIERLYHRRVGENPIGVECRYSRPLQNSEQLYQREYLVTEEPKPLDYGWVEKAGHIHIENLEGNFPQVIPTKEEKEEAEKKVVVLGQDWEISPGETFRGTPTSTKSPLVHCKSGPALIRVTVWPR